MGGKIARERILVTRPMSKWSGLLWLALLPLPGESQTRYRLSFPEAAQHYVQVEAHYPTGGECQVELFMPVWTPGYYQILNHSQQVDRLRATGIQGQSLGLEVVSKSRWRVDCTGQSEVILTYRVQGESGAPKNSVNSYQAVLQGAATFISPVKPVQSGFQVRVELPPGWKSIQTGLPPAPGGEQRTFLARDFDQLIDCPILAGSPTYREFQVAGVRHFLVYADQPSGSTWDAARAARDVKAVVETTYRLWGFFPFAQDPAQGYWFLNLPVGGALEHKNSSSIPWNPGRWAEPEKYYLHWLRTVSHEYFHAWNGKNLRPVALGPFDYEARSDTPSLWIAEGLTTYYSNLLLARSGLITGTEYLRQLSVEISRVAGRRGISLLEASRQAWDAGPKLASFYSGGMIVGFLLDQQVRQATGGRASLDHVMREAYRQYSGECGYTEEQFEAAASQVAGIDLSDFFRRSVHGTEPLDFTPALRYYGLRFQADPKLSARHTLGLSVQSSSGRLIVNRLVRESSAEKAGLEIGDELLQVKGAPLSSEPELDSRLKRCEPDGTVDLLVARRGRPSHVRLQVGDRLELDPAAGSESRGHWEAYLKG